MNPEHKKPYLTILYLLLYSALIFYVVYRAYILGFTHDESLSYAIIKGDPDLGKTANHHLLNTWLMRICAALFGERELSLRLPNVMAFLLYLFYFHRLVLSKNAIAGLLIALPLLLLNPFILDFFSLARGYGLSLGFMMGSLYYLLRGNGEQPNNTSIIKDFALSLMFAALALFANLAMLNFYLSVMGIFCIKYLLFSFKAETQNKKAHFLFAFVLTIALLILLPIVARLFVLKEANELYFGADYLARTFMTLFERMYYFSVFPRWFSFFLKYLMIALFLAGIFLAFYRKIISSPLAKMAMLISFILIGLITERHLFSALYPEGRTGIYFIPLFGLFLLYFFSDAVQYLSVQKKKIALIILFLLFTLPLSFHFLRKLNYKYTLEWRYDSYTKEVMSYIFYKDSPHKHFKILTMSSNWLFAPTLNYYIQSRDMYFKPVSREGVSMETDFVYEYRENVKDERLKELLFFEVDGTALYRNTSVLKERGSDEEEGEAEIPAE